jgi:hypothetical protein
MENGLIHIFSVKERGRRGTKFHWIECAPGEEDLDSDGIRALTEREQQKFPADVTLNYFVLGEHLPLVVKRR